MSETETKTTTPSVSETETKTIPSVSETETKTIPSEVFSKVDTNSDNVITNEEMATFLKNNPDGLGNADLAKQLTDKGITSIDLNGDGNASLGEFAMASMGGTEISKTDFEAKYGSEEATKLFDKYDTNKDGKITSDEIKEVDKAKGEEESKGLSTAAIIGIVVGAVCVVGLIVGLIVYFSRKEDKDKGSGNSVDEDKEKGIGNSFDNERKDIEYKTENSLDSVNKAKDKDKGLG